MNAWASIAGRMAGHLGDKLREERQLRGKTRAAQGMERYQSGLRMGELTLKQYMEENSPEYKARMDLLGSQKGAADAATAHTTAQTEALGAPLDPNSVEARNAAAREQEASTRQQIADYNQTQTTASQVQDTEAKSLAEKIAADDAQFSRFVRDNPRADPEQIYNYGAYELRLDEETHPLWKQWLNRQYKQAQSARSKQGGDSGFGAPIGAPQGAQGAPPRVSPLVDVSPIPNSIGAPMPQTPGQSARAAGAAQAAPQAIGQDPRLQRIVAALQAQGKTPAQIDSILAQYRR